MAELLEIDRLSLGFGTREGRLHALREVSFAVRRGRQKRFFQYCAPPTAPTAARRSAQAV